VGLHVILDTTIIFTFYILTISHGVTKYALALPRNNNILLKHKHDCHTTKTADTTQIKLQTVTGLTVYLL